MASKTDSDWYSALPSWAKVFVQLGFAAVVAGLFVSDSTTRSKQLTEYYQESRNQSREDRIVFREELKLQREELRSTVEQLKRAIDTMASQQNKMKSEIDDIKYPFPKPKEKP